MGNSKDTTAASPTPPIEVVPARTESAGDFARKALAVTLKDIRIEMRTRELFASMFIFALIVSVLFNYTLDLKATQIEDVAGGLLWMVFAFAGVLGLNRIFTSESEAGTLQGLLVAPIDRSALYLGKLLSTVVFIAVTQLINVPIFALFANLSFANLLPLIPVFLLGTIGFSAVGTLFAAIAANTRMREVMLPILLLPLTMPVLMACIQLTGTVLRGQPIESDRQWLSLLLAYDVIFVVVGTLIFEAITQED
ncbi:MAG: heme exporter protein CcmB [Chloroflexi bacterium]|nr:heme exporter protein CcmB [Chloroflexota bacterium]